MILKSTFAFTLALATALFPLSASSFTIAPSTTNTAHDSKAIQPQGTTDSPSPKTPPQKKEEPTEKHNQLSTTTGNKSGKK